MPNILVVEDDDIMLKAIRNILSKDGFNVITAKDGKEAFEKLDSTEFDIVVTDLGMPHVDGRKVATSVKGVSPSTPVVLLTGWGQRLIATNDAPAHVDKVLAKPPRLHELRAALAELVA